MALQLRGLGKGEYNNSDRQIYSHSNESRNAKFEDLESSSEHFPTEELRECARGENQTKSRRLQEKMRKSVENIEQRMREIRLSNKDAPKSSKCAQQLIFGKSKGHIYCI